MEKEKKCENAEPSEYMKLWLNYRFVDRSEYEKNRQDIQEELDRVSEKLAEQAHYLNTLSNVLNKTFWPVLIAIVLFFVTFGLNKILY